MRRVPQSLPNRDMYLRYTRVHLAYYILCLSLLDHLMLSERDVPGIMPNFSSLQYLVAILAVAGRHAYVQTSLPSLSSAVHVF